MSFKKVLDKYRKISFNERDKGVRFERLMQADLKTDPKYAYLFKKEWLLSEFLEKRDLSGLDAGFNLVVYTKTVNIEPYILFTIQFRQNLRFSCISLFFTNEHKRG